MEQSYASTRSQLDPGFVRKPLFRIVVSLFLVVAVLLSGMAKVDVAELGGGLTLTVVDEAGIDVGSLETRTLGVDGSLKLGYKSGRPETYGSEFQWWQLAERDDRPGYPRIDPQSGGSGLPGARGEDEDPAYYSAVDFKNPELAARIFEGGAYWLLDRPSHDSGFHFESWLVHRTGPKSAHPLVGISWGITVRAGEVVGRHHPQPILGRSRFDWAESLRISGFGTGWSIAMAHRPQLP